MTAEQHLSQLIGNLLIQVATLLAERDILKEELAVLKATPKD